MLLKEVILHFYKYKYHLFWKNVKTRTKKCWKSGQNPWKKCDKSGYITEVEVYTKSPYEKIFKKTKKVVEKIKKIWL